MGCPFALPQAPINPLLKAIYDEWLRSAASEPRRLLCHQYRASREYLTDLPAFPLPVFIYCKDTRAFDNLFPRDPGLRCQLKITPLSF